MILRRIQEALGASNELVLQEVVLVFQLAEQRPEDLRDEREVKPTRSSSCTTGRSQRGQRDADQDLTAIEPVEPPRSSSATISPRRSAGIAANGTNGTPLSSTNSAQPTVETVLSARGTCLSISTSGVQEQDDGSEGTRRSDQIGTAGIGEALTARCVERDAGGQ